MLVLPSDVWKLGLAILLGAAIFIGAYGTAPKRKAPDSELRRLVLSALGLYAVGALATLSDHPTLAALVFAAGITICAFALWLSRGHDSGEDPPRGGEQPSDERPPPEPDGLPEFDFAAFERQFRDYAERSREPALR
jgi:hypothetical protein